jgi:hypothetical protein
MMTIKPQQQQDPAEGSRETIDRELARAKHPRPAAHPAERAPGDEAVPGTPGTGEDICPECRGSGRIGPQSCFNCNGSGRIIKAIGGA